MADDPITGAESLIQTAINKWLPDAGQKDKDALTLELAQINANAAEASQPGLHFRDGAGWVCVVAFASNFVIRPWALAILHILGVAVDIPLIDTSEIYPMLFALLGLGGMHVYQQAKQ